MTNTRRRTRWTSCCGRRARRESRPGTAPSAPGALEAEDRPPSCAAQQCYVRQGGVLCLYCGSDQIEGAAFTCDAGAAGAVENPIIAGNIITGSGAATSNGIQLRGLIVNANISGNDIRNLARGFLGAVANTHAATGAAIHFNNFVVIFVVVFITIGVVFIITVVIITD